MPKSQVTDAAKGCYESSCQRAKCKLACNYKRAQPKFAEGNDFVYAVPFVYFRAPKVKIETTAYKFATND